MEQIKSQSAQLKPGLPNIGNDPISQALAWVRNQANNVGTTIGDISNRVVNKSMLGKTMQGKFNELPQAFHETNQNLGYEALPGETMPQQIQRMLDKNMFVGEMELKPNPGIIINSKGEVANNSVPEVKTGTHLIKDKSGNFIENPNYKGGIYSQEAPEYPQSVTDAQKAKGINYTQPEPKTSPPIEPPPAERTFSHEMATKEDLLSNLKRNIIIDGKNIRTPGEANQVNATLNGYGIKGSQTQQLQSVSDKIDDLANQAKNIVSNQGGTIDKNELINQTMQKLSYGSVPDTSTQQMAADARNYVNDLYVRATGQDVTKGVVAPEKIPGNILQDMKRLSNIDAQSTFEQEDPTKWNIRQRVSRYGRDAIDTLLDREYPAASKLNNDMSDLYKSQASLRKGAIAEGNEAQKVANAPQPNLFQRAENALKSHPIGALALGGASVYGLPKIISGATSLGTYALSQLPSIENKIADTLGYTPKTNADNEKKNEQISHNGSISSNLKYSTQTPLDDGTIISEQAQADRQKALQAKIGAEKLGDPQAANEDTAIYQQNETEFNSQSNLRKLSNDTLTVVKNANNAYENVSIADPSFMNALSKGFDNLAKEANGKYAGMATSLQALSKISGVDLSTAKSKDALLAAIDAIVESQQTKLDTAKTQYFGSQSPEIQNDSNSLPTPTAQGLSSIPQQKVNWSANDPKVQAIMGQ